MAQRTLGLDVGAAEVRAVVVEGGRTATVRAARTVGVPAATEGESPLLARQLEAARAAVADLAFDGAVVSLPGLSATHVVTLPFADPRRIEQTVGFEVEGQIPFDLADVAWDWQVARQVEGRTELLVAVARRAELAELLAGLAPLGVDPRAVLPPALAYADLFAAGALAPPSPAPAAATEPAQALLDLAGGRASLSVVRAGVSEAARTFAATPSGPALAREVRATLRAWRARPGLEPAGAGALGRLVLCGEAARLPGLAEALAGEVDGPVEAAILAGPGIAVDAALRAAGDALPPPEDAPAAGAALDGGYALALALALRARGGARGARLNLRRGDLAYTRDFQHLRGKLGALAGWVAAIALLALASSAVRAFALSRQDALLDAALCDATRQLVGKCFDSEEQAVAALRGRNTPAASIPRRDAADVLTELSNHTPDVSLRYDRIEITRDKLHLQGVTDAAEIVDRIVDALRASPCFTTARSGGARKRPSDGKFEFTLDADLTCEAGGAAGGRS